MNASFLHLLAASAVMAFCLAPVQTPVSITHDGVGHMPVSLSMRSLQYNQCQEYSCLSGYKLLRRT